MACAFLSNRVNVHRSIRADLRFIRCGLVDDDSLVDRSCLVDNNCFVHLSCDIDGNILFRCCLIEWDCLVYGLVDFSSLVDDNCLVNSAVDLSFYFNRNSLVCLFSGLVYVDCLIDFTCFVDLNSFVNCLVDYTCLIDCDGLIYFRFFRWYIGSSFIDYNGLVNGSCFIDHNSLVDFSCNINCDIFLRFGLVEGDDWFNGLINFSGWVDCNVLFNGFIDDSFDFDLNRFIVFSLVCGPIYIDFLINFACFVDLNGLVYGFVDGTCLVDCESLINFWFRFRFIGRSFVDNYCFVDGSGLFYDKSLVLFSCDVDGYVFLWFTLIEGNGLADIFIDVSSDVDGDCLTDGLVQLSLNFYWNCLVCVFGCWVNIDGLVDKPGFVDLNSLFYSLVDYANLTYFYCYVLLRLFRFRFVGRGFIDYYCLVYGSCLIDDNRLVHLSCYVYGDIFLRFSLIEEDCFVYGFVDFSRLIDDNCLVDCAVDYSFYFNGNSLIIVDSRTVDLYCLIYFACFVNFDGFVGSLVEYTCLIDCDGLIYFWFFGYIGSSLVDYYGLVDWSSLVDNYCLVYFSSDIDCDIFFRLSLVISECLIDCLIIIYSCLIDINSLYYGSIFFFCYVKSNCLIIFYSCFIDCYYLINGSSFIY